MINFYPPVTDLVSTNDIPEKLGFLQQGIDILIGGLHYKDYVQDISQYGDQGFVGITIVPYIPLELPVPGTEMQLILNPGSQPGTSEFPISMSYEWEVLKYVRGFKISNFTGTAKDLFDLLLEILGTSVADLLEGTLFNFIPTDNNDHVQLFIDNFNGNSKYNPAQLTHPNTGDVKTDVTDLLSQLDTLNISPIDIIFEDYLSQDNGSGASLESIAQSNIETLLNQVRNSFSMERFKQMLIPQASASLDNIDVGLTFPTSYVRQVDPQTFVPLQDADGKDVPSMLVFNVGRIRFSTEHGFEFEQENSFSFPTSEIGKTGLIVNFHNLKADLSRTKNIPEANADGRPVDFIGAYVTEATIALPEKWFKEQNDTTAKIYARNLLVGTGGISGNLGLEAHPTSPPATGVEPELSLKLGDNGFAIALNRFNVEFRQGAVVQSDIKGSITIPNLKELDENDDEVSGDLKLGVRVHFDDDGDFSITASPEDGAKKLGIKDVFSFDLDTFTVGREDDRYYVAVSGSLNIIANLPVSSALPKGIEITKLLIWEDGSFEIATDVPPLAQSFSVTIGPVNMYASNIHIGSYEKNDRPYKYFGFDGGLNVNPNMVDARGTGIKLYFSVDGGPLDVFIRIQRIDVDIIIPANSDEDTAAMILNGFLAMRDGPNSSTEYAGGIDLRLPRLGMRAKAAMRLNPDVPNFIVDVDFESNKGIPLGATGLGIYGFRGLVGKHFVARKDYPDGVEETDPWWKYYKVDPPAEGIHVDKFDPEMEGFSLGAGVSLATTADSGYAFSSKLFFLLSLPNVFLFEGKAAVLQKRKDVNVGDDPPFFAMLAVDDSSIEAAIGVDYKMPESGDLFKKIAHLYGIMELGFFFGNSNAWYVNIGRDMPEDMRVQAQIGKLFQAYAYLMLSSKQIKLGAGATFGDTYYFPKNKKTVELTLEAYLDIAAKISFSPKQFGGSLALGGELGIKVFGLGFSISADAFLAGETPKPYIIIGKLGVFFRALGKKFEFNIDLEWIKDPNPNTDEIQLLSAPDHYGELPAQATNILTKEKYRLMYLSGTSSAIPAPGNSAWSKPFMDVAIPVDSFIDIEFAKPVKPFTSGSGKTKLGGVTSGYKNTEQFPPEKAKTEPLFHTYEVEDVSIKYWDNGSWKDYDVYEALTPINDLGLIDPAELTNKKYGYWQMQKPEVYNKLRILAQTPISHLKQ